MYYSEDYSGDVLKLLWEPLKENVSVGATIYYVPSQVLSRSHWNLYHCQTASLLG